MDVKGDARVRHGIYRTDKHAGRPAFTPDGEPIVYDDFARNHDPEDLVRYRGNWVAWSRDGRKVLFASPDPMKLFELIDAAGLDSNEYVVGGIEANW